MASCSRGRSNRRFTQYLIKTGMGDGLKIIDAVYEVTIELGGQKGDVGAGMDAGRVV